jgi:hypothetical protein
MVVHELHLAAVVEKHEPVADLRVAVRCTERGTDNGERVADMDFNRGGQHGRGEQQKDGESFHGGDDRYLD